MIVWLGSSEVDDTYPYERPGHIWIHPTHITEEAFKKKYGFLAKFECMDKNCKFRFETRPGLLNCFKCGYIFVKWLNVNKCLKAIHK